MSILGWIIFGLITGFIASKIVSSRGQGCFIDIALGLVGAMVGGFIFRQLAHFNAFHFNLVSMFVAIIGAVVVLTIYHAITGRGGLR
jgi:uncharacterized membrane protein YeaQ/YmgE (transglycosylase-associated protein family)